MDRATVTSCYGSGAFSQSSRCWPTAEPRRASCRGGSSSIRIPDKPINCRLAAFGASIGERRLRPIKQRLSSPIAWPFAERSRRLNVRASGRANGAPWPTLADTADPPRTSAKDQKITRAHAKKDASLCLAVVARLAHGLPVALIPEQTLVASMRDHVIDHGRGQHMIEQRTLIALARRCARRYSCAPQAAKCV